MDSREIDSLVAEKIMGFELLEVRYWDHDETERQKEIKEWLNKVGLDMVGEYYIDIKNDFWIRKDYYRPTEEISSAWEIVEKLDLNEFCVSRFYTLNNDLEYHVYMDDGTKNYEVIKAPTLNMAICKATLRTVGIEI